MDSDTHIITKSSQETARVGREMAASLVSGGSKGSAATVVCLYGELGSGKTTFVQGFARGLGWSGRLPSPTFIIVRRYSLKDQDFLYHLDLYRIQTEAEIQQLGIKEMFRDPHAYVVIEWADRLGTMVPKRRFDIYFSVNEEQHHDIHISSKI